MVRLRKRAALGELVRPSYRMPGSPWTNWIVLVFLLLIVVLAAFSDELAVRASCYAVPVVVVALFAGWRLVRRSRSSIADGRAGESEM